MKFKYQNCCGPIIPTSFKQYADGNWYYCDHKIVSVKIPEERWHPKIMRRLIEKVRRKVGF